MAFRGLARVLHNPFYLNHLVISGAGLAYDFARIRSVPLPRRPYIQSAGLGQRKKSPLFPALYRRQALSDEPLPRHKAWQMVKRRSKAAGLSTTTSPHSWRGSGITEYLRNGGSLETAQEIAAHESSRTTKLYDRSQGEITLDEIERIPAV